jgi:hypothetical protein
MLDGFSAGKMKGIMVGVIIALITVTIVIQLVANIVPTVLLAFSNLAAVSGLSFASFYGTSGVMNIVLGAVVLILVLGLMLLLIPGKSMK